MARIYGLDVFIQIFYSVIVCLEPIKNNEGGSWNSESVRDAGGLFHAAVSFPFIFCLVVVSRMLEITRPPTKQLQSSKMDVVVSEKNITLLFTALTRLRSEIDVKHNEWYEEAVQLAESVGSSAERPRTVRHQINRANAPAESTSQYFKISVTLPFLDHLTSEINTRFSKRNLSLSKGFYGLPASVVSSPDWKENFSIFLGQYQSDLPEPRYIKTEMEMWEDHCRLLSSTPTSLSSLLPTIDRITFPNIYTAFQILATIPVTTCTCERSISTL